MICLGNICRSPLAQAILESKVDSEEVMVDSAGTSNYHVGYLPDERSIRIGKKFNLDLSAQRGRQFEIADFDEFDQIYVMDHENYSDVISLARNEEEKAKISMILNKVFIDENRDVPDPYFGEGEEGFLNVYKLLDTACDRIANELS